MLAKLVDVGGPCAHGFRQSWSVSVSRHRYCSVMASSLASFAVVAGSQDAPASMTTTGACSHGDYFPGLDDAGNQQQEADRYVEFLLALLQLHF